MTSLIRSKAEVRKGIYRLIDLLQCTGFRIALATSSSQPIISAVLDKLDIKHVFDLTLSADDVDNGKPSPDVYLEVCRRLNITPDKAIALEDSLTGVKAAVAANITTIAIPEKITSKFDIANHSVTDIEDVALILNRYLAS